MNKLTGAVIALGLCLSGNLAAETTRQPKTGITGKGDEAPMVLVPAGEFIMGSIDSRNEKPIHRVFLDDFYMDKYEVTIKRHAAFLHATSRIQPARWDEASQVSNRERPVIGVDWNDAEAYCRHYEKRLPTEAEWEKAARGTDGREYPWGNKEPSRRYANYGKFGGLFDYGTLTPGGEYKTDKSPYGVYDMAGNVWEWVADWYDEDYYQRSPDRNPTGPSSGSEKVYRSGAWNSFPADLRSARRLSNGPRPRPRVPMRENSLSLFALRLP
jgi:formylglycine-generating enzyme required for sulfatase activity